MTTQLTLFDYAALDAETRIVVQQEDKEFDRNIGDAGTSYLRACHSLQRIHTALRYKRPGFVSYVDSKPGLSIGTAHKMLNIAKMFSDYENIPIASREALALLADPDTPDGAREEALIRAEEGEAITFTKAQGIIHDHKYPADDDEPLSPYEQQIAERYDTDLPLEADEHARLDDGYDRRTDQRQQQIQVITGSSETNEWYTPQWLIDLARDVLGEIDLDPASCPAAQAVVRAASYCTADEDGFGQPWFGRVWLNPPYGAAGEGAAGWARKLIREYTVGQVTSAILLVKAALGYNWFEELWYAYPTCVLRDRVTFVSPIDGTTRGPAKHATALVYFGQDINRFRAVFRPYGRVLLPEADDAAL